MTLRPVRVLVDNEVWDAGEYTGKGAIGWDGTSTAGEDLARGIYFCQIMVADGFEPEYAILKLALNALSKRLSAYRELDICPVPDVDTEGGYNVNDKANC